MCSRPTQIHFAFIITLVVIVGFAAASCRYSRSATDGARLDASVTAIDSPGEIERIIRSSLAEKYLATNIAEGYTMHQVTNGPIRWLFVKAFNAPRGLDMFNLYCYEQENPSNWLLRAYVPVNAHYYTNGLERDVTIEMDDNYTKVVFRGKVVFTGASKKYSGK
jgi:hypothetical protein